MRDSKQETKMDETVSQGPVVEFKRKPREVRPQFTTIMNHLRRWRVEDHEDNIALSRNLVIEIIEGVDALIEGAKPPR
jgi:hypothetical protein